ncbi:MAG: hypothetical protein ACYDH5_03830 [Acidimicrobiales bacterium]
MVWPGPRVVPGPTVAKVPAAGENVAGCGLGDDDDPKGADELAEDGGPDELDDAELDAHAAGVPDSPSMANGTAVRTATSARRGLAHP